MGRLIRFDAPRAIQHVFTAGAGPCPIYADADDYLTFVAIVGQTLARYGWRCLSYCLMTTHYHLIVRTESGDISAGMEHLNGNYARSFNRRHGRRGHLFGSRFGSVFVQDHAHFQTVVRYVALNPLDAGVLPQDWPWSSYATAVAGMRDPLAANDEVIAMFGGLDRLRAFVEDGLVLRAAA
jgi:REP-associated tyrosine transposase